GRAGDDTQTTRPVAGGRLRCGPDHRRDPDRGDPEPGFRDTVPRSRATADDRAADARTAGAAGHETRHHPRGRSRHESVPQRAQHLRGGAYRAWWDIACGTGLAGTAFAPAAIVRSDHRLLAAGRSRAGGGGAAGYRYRWSRRLGVVPAGRARGGGVAVRA